MKTKPHSATCTNRLRIFLAPVVLLSAIAANAKTIRVSENGDAATLAAAYALAEAGDTILVAPKPEGDAYREVLRVAKSGITFKSADPDRKVRVDATGQNVSGRGAHPRAIFQFDKSADGCVLDGFELVNAHNESCNGAGVRVNEADNITIRNCVIRDNDSGIMSNGSGGTCANLRIERCVITDNGNVGDYGKNHNLYLGGESVTIANCEVARAVTGHNVKSRARFNRLEGNHIHDAKNREVEFVDAPDTATPGADAVLVNNTITKSPTAENKTALHFGADGGGTRNGMLYLDGNILTGGSPIIDVSGGNGIALRNNTVNGGGVLVNVRAESPVTVFGDDSNTFSKRYEIRGARNAHSEDLTEPVPPMPTNSKRARQN